MMEGNPAAGSRRNKALAVLAALCVGLGGWALGSAGNGTFRGSATSPFGPNAFALSRSIVRSGPPSGSTSTTTTSTTSPRSTSSPSSPASIVSPKAVAAALAGPPERPVVVADESESKPSGSAHATPAPAPAHAAATGGGGGAAAVARDLINAVDSLSKGVYRIPVTADNVSLLQRWMANEGGLWANNPLNTSLDSAHYPHQFTSGGTNTGIPIFPTMAAGVQATAKTLLDNSVYSHILGQLKSGSASCVAFATAVIHTPWASSHYGYDPSRFCQGQIPPTRAKHRRGSGRHVQAAPHAPSARPAHPAAKPTHPVGRKIHHAK